MDFGWSPGLSLDTPNFDLRTCFRANIFHKFPSQTYKTHQTPFGWSGFIGIVFQGSLWKRARGRSSSMIRNSRNLRCLPSPCQKHDPNLQHHNFDHNLRIMIINKRIEKSPSFSHTHTHFNWWKADFRFTKASSLHVQNCSNIDRTWLSRITLLSNVRMFVLVV